MRWGGPLADVGQPLEGQGQVGAPLGGGQRVDLVDDHRLDARQRVPGLRREHEVERLGRGDEDVGRRAQHLAAHVGRGVAGAQAHRRLAERLAQPLGAPPGCRRGAPAGSCRRRPPAPAAATRRPAGCPREAGTGLLTSRSMPHRKAASVLPEPVGARISVWSPAAMAGQPWLWAGVGAGKLDSNQAARPARTARSPHPQPTDGV